MLVETTSAPREMVGVKLGGNGVSVGVSISSVGVSISSVGVPISAAGVPVSAAGVPPVSSVGVALSLVARKVAVGDLERGVVVGEMSLTSVAEEAVWVADGESGVGDMGSGVAVALAVAVAVEVVATTGVTT